MAPPAEHVQDVGPETRTSWAYATPRPPARRAPGLTGVRANTTPDRGSPPRGRSTTRRPARATSAYARRPAGTRTGGPPRNRRQRSGARRILDVTGGRRPRGGRRPEAARSCRAAGRHRDRQPEERRSRGRQTGHEGSPTTAAPQTAGAPRQHPDDTGSRSLKGVLQPSGPTLGNRPVASTRRQDLGDVSHTTRHGRSSWKTPQARTRRKRPTRPGRWWARDCGRAASCAG